MSNISKEDYLRVIYKGIEEMGIVNPTMVAVHLNISNAAVTDMIKKLKREKYVSYNPYKGIQLLQKGKLEAIRLVRRHRIWETFLYQIVGIPWYEIDEEAENLEHSSSDNLVDHLEKILNYPEFDPHGHPIPKKDGKIPKQKKCFSLDQINIGKSGIIQKVNDHSKEFLLYLFNSGLLIRKKIKVLDKRNFDGSIIISIDNKELVLSDKISKNIFVEKIK